MANRFSPGKGGRQAQTNDRIANTVDALSPAAAFAVQTAPNITAAPGGVVVCSPRATGQSLVIPEASGANFNQTITVMVQSALGSLRIRAAKGLINGAVAFTLAAGYTTLIVLRSNGSTGWITERASGFPIAGDSLEYDGETLNYVGTDSIVSLVGISGAQGVIDISNLKCGGAVAVSGPVGDWSIAGFTDREAGFWFCFNVSNTAFLGTILNEAGAVQTAIRCTNDEDVIAQAIQAFVFNSPSTLNASSRWRFVSDATNNVVQRITAGSGSPLVDFALNPNTRILQLDYGNSAWVIDSLAGGYGGRKLTIENASNTASTGSIVHSTATGAAANRIICPGDVNRGGYSRYSAELEYDGTDSVWRIVADTGPQNNSNQILEIRYSQIADASISEAIPAGCTWFEVEGVGGGGGSGGCDADQVKESCASAGGGAGAWFRHRFTVTTGAITGAIGAAGAAGTDTGGNGGTGGTTTCTYDGVSITGPGGAGSLGNTTGNATDLAFQYIAGALGATADANATERADGGDGDVGKMWATSTGANSACGGLGGASYYGGGGRPGFGNTDGATGTGSAGRAPGSGGGGSARVSTGAASAGVAGAAGAPGCMKLTFYNGPRPPEATIN